MFVIDTVENPVLYANTRGVKGVELLLRDEEEDRSYLIKQTVAFDDALEDFDIKQNESRKDGYRAFIYSKETLVMQPIAELQNVLKEYFTRNPQEQECLLLLNPIQLRCVISKVPDLIRYMRPKEQESVKVEEKSDLKTYETPSSFLNLFVDNVALAYMAQIKSLYIKKHLMKLKRSKAKELSEKLVMKRSDLESQIEKAISPLSKLALAESEDMSGVRLPQKIKDEVYPLLAAKTIEELQKVASKMEIPRVEPYANFIDLQAGSGEAMLETFDKTGLNAVLQGTEYRKIENDDPRYKVITDVNFIPFADTIAATLRKKTLESNISNSIFWLNPPYTTDDYVARESLEILPSGSFVAGLFPTKMLSFVKRRINGFLYVIPKELTGYTESNIPQEFLFVMGRRNKVTEESALEQDNIRAEVMKIPSSTDLGTFKERVFANLVYDLYYQVYVNDAIHYFNEERLSMFSRYLAKDIEQKRELFKKSEHIENILQEGKKKIFDSFLPTKNALKMKLFPDMRFFSKDGKYEKLRFYDVAKNVPLLEYYKNIVPSLFKIVVNIAEENGVALPVDSKEGLFRPFDLENPKEYAKSKERVTNKELGMMRLYYYPNVILLRTQEQKRMFLDMAKEILQEEHEKLLTQDEGKESQASLKNVVEAFEMLEDFVQKADRVVVKSARTYLELEETIGSSDVFVFVDDFGLDIGKLNIPLTAIYQKMEEKGYFQMDDVVELAEIPKEKKERIIGNFFNYFDGVLKDIHRFLVQSGSKDGSFDDFKKEVLLKGEEIVRMLRDKTSLSKINKEIVKWAKANDFDRYFEDKFVMPNTELMLKQSIDKNLDFLPKSLRKELFDIAASRTRGRIITFYEGERHDFLSALKEHIADFIEGDEAKEERFENFVIAFNDALTGEYNIKSAIVASYSKLADFYLKEYTLAHLLKKSGRSEEEIFDKIFKDLLVKRFKLRPHQAEEAMRYCAIEDEKRLEMLYWEMRAGKTRAMIAIGFILGLLDGDKDIDLVLETANMPDIAQQMFESFPFMMANANFFVGDEGKLQFIDNENIFTTFPSDEVYANIVKIFQSNLVGKGDTANEMKKSLLEDYELIVKAMERGEIDVEEVFESYQKTPYAKLLEGCK